MNRVRAIAHRIVQDWRHRGLQCRVPVLATVLGLSLLGSCGGLLVASSLLLFNDSVRRRLVPGLVSYAVGALLGVALLNLLPEALTFLAPGAVFATLLGGNPRLLRARKAGPDSSLPHRRVPGPRGDGGAGDHRRRLSQFHRWRDYLHGRAGVGAARHQHGDRRRGPRDSAGSRRRRDSARRRIQPPPRAPAQSRVGRLRPGRRARGVRDHPGDPHDPAVRARVFVGQPALHRDVGSHPGSAPWPDRRQLAASGRSSSWPASRPSSSSAGWSAERP